MRQLDHHLQGLQNTVGKGAETLQEVCLQKTSSGHDMHKVTTAVIFTHLRKIGPISVSLRRGRTYRTLHFLGGLLAHFARKVCHVIATDKSTLLQ